MSRVYDELEVNGFKLHCLFDTGARRNYVTRQAIKEDQRIEKLRVAYEVGLGGKSQRITEFCVLQGDLQGHALDLLALVVENLGTDERGREIGLLFGAEAMEVWGIQIDPARNRIDLSCFPKEFVEY